MLHKAFRVTNPKIELKPELLFAGKSTRTHLTPRKGVHYQRSAKGSYQIETILSMIDKVPNRYSMFKEQSFAIFVFDDYYFHLMPEVRQALFKKGYILVIIGGRIIIDIQINDTNCHCNLKKHNRDLEMKSMLEQLEKSLIKILSPSRNEMMSMLLHA